MSWLDGKIGLVTGGASGIGLAIAKEFLKNGLKGLTVADVDVENGEAVTRKLAEDFGPNRILFVKVDVSRPEEVEETYRKTVETFGHLDIVVNSAGILNDRLWQKEIAINLCGTIHVCLLGLDKYLPPHRSGDEAVIVNVSSLCGLIDTEAVPVYSATKHGIIGLSRSLGTENHYKRTKVRILTICPGMTETPLVNDVKGRLIGPEYEQLYANALPLFSFQKPEEVAKGVVEIIQKGRNGSTWLINAGKTSEVELPDMFALLQK